ncbi:Crp/Fnr family transcriptional regulator [Chloroflexota bacterium]
MASQAEFLKSVPYFSGLNPTELDSISHLIFEKTAERGEIILLEGESAEALFFVASGAVKVLKTSAEGKEQILSIVRPGEPFNDVPIFDGGPNPTSAQAMGPVTLYGLRANDLKTIIQNHLQVALNIIKVLASRVRQLVSLVEDLSFRHVLGRVAKILLENASDATDLKPRLTHQEMAAMAGTAREVVGRSLKTLEDEGVIRFDRHRIVITNKKALEKLVEMP